MHAFFFRIIFQEFISYESNSFDINQARHKSIHTSCKDFQHKAFQQMSLADS